MFYGYDKSLNAYALSDEEVAADWRNGMVRAAARKLVEAGKAEGEILGSWGAHVGFRAGTLAEHFDAAMSKSEPKRPGDRYFAGHGSCAITSVTNLREDSDERYESNSFGDGRSYTDSVLDGTVTCVHGVTGQMTFAASLGELISAIVSGSE